MSSNEDYLAGGAPALTRRPPLPTRPVIVAEAEDEVEELDYAEQPAVANRNTPLILGIVGVGGIIALLLVALILGNLSKPPPGNPAVNVIAGCPASPHNGEEAPAAGYLAPNFSATTLDGTTVHLADYRGKKAVWLNFWASWCGPCKAEMPDIQTLYNQHQDKDVQFLGFDLREEKPTVKGFVDSNKYNWTFLLEPGGATADMYYVTGIPTHVFIDRCGVIQELVASGLPKTVMEQYLKKIITTQ